MSGKDVAILHILLTALVFLVYCIIMFLILMYILHIPKLGPQRYTQLQILYLNTGN